MEFSPILIGLMYVVVLPHMGKLGMVWPCIFSGRSMSSTRLRKLSPYVIWLQFSTALGRLLIGNVYVPQNSNAMQEGL